MSKKMKALVSMLLAVILLTAGSAAAVMAQEDEEPAPPAEESAAPMEANSLLTRVAEVLGIPEEELTEAFQQARQEMMQERWEEVFYQMLEKAVAEELITPEEAEEITEWWAQKPEALDPGLLRHAFQFRERNPLSLPGNDLPERPMMSLRSRQEESFSPGQEGNFPPGQEMRQEAFRRVLEKALADGRIAPEKVAEVKEWLENPGTSDQLPPPAHFLNNAERGRQMRVFARGREGPATD